jgi:hypothetical protein
VKLALKGSLAVARALLKPSFAPTKITGAFADLLPIGSDDIVIVGMGIRLYGLVALACFFFIRRRSFVVFTLYCTLLARGFLHRAIIATGSAYCLAQNVL